VPEVAEIVSRGGADVVVRVNRPLCLAVRDIEAAVALPKVDRAVHVRLIAEIVDEVERGVAQGRTRLIAMVETAAAFFRIADIARAHPRLCALNLGAEDFTTSAGISPDVEALSIPSRRRCSPPAPPASCHWASSVRSPSSATSTAFA
jgi:citrate lyase subunit beta / citryl-CoA lyase